MTGSRRDWRGRWDRLIADSKWEVTPEALPFPTDAQLDLLKAALLPAESAAPAWRRWKARGLELQTVADHASMNVFPQLFANREAAGIGIEDLLLLKGIYRHTVAYNAAALSNGLTMVRLLESAGIPVLFIKGAAIIGMLGALGVRRIDDVDILIPESDAERAISIVLAGGYRDAKPDSRLVGFSHARAYRKATGPPVDIHWRAFKNAGDDSGFFKSAREATVLGHTVRVPSATDSLVLTFANAFQLWGSPLMRWISDSVWILRNCEIDWALMLERAHRPGVAPALTEGLTYLAREFNAPVPAEVLIELRRIPVSWQERGAHWAVMNRPPVGAFTLEQLDRHRARRLHSSDNWPRDFLWHMAASSGTQRRDLIRRAPRTAARSVALLLLIGGRKLLEQPMRRIRLHGAVSTEYAGRHPGDH